MLFVNYFIVTKPNLFVKMYGLMAMIRNLQITLSLIILIFLFLSPIFFKQNLICVDNKNLIMLTFTKLQHCGWKITQAVRETL